MTDWILYSAPLLIAGAWAYLAGRRSERHFERIARRGDDR